jgi:cation transport protein ChaC
VIAHAIVHERTSVVLDVEVQAAQVPVQRRVLIACLCQQCGIQSPPGTLAVSARYLDLFSDVPENLRWSKERIDESMRATLQGRPRGAVWIFAYGSLMWNPQLELTEVRRGRLEGWHRSFCLRAIAGRGSLAAPGRMLSLEPGGETLGLALCLDQRSLYEELGLVWTREMPTGAYVPTWCPVSLVDGRVVHTITFVANSSHPLHGRDASVGAVAPLIAAASGPLGSNADYVMLLERSLADEGMEDAYVRELATTLRRIAAAASPVPPCELDTLSK